MDQKKQKTITTFHRLMIVVLRQISVWHEHFFILLLLHKQNKKKINQKFTPQFGSTMVPITKALKIETRKRKIAMKNSLFQIKNIKKKIETKTKTLKVKEERKSFMSVRERRTSMGADIMTVMVKLEPARVIVERERRERVMKNEISRSWFEREKREKK